MSDIDLPDDFLDLDDATLAERLGLDAEALAADMAMIRLVSAYGEQIRVMRKARGLSRADLAVKLDISPTRVAQLESGTLRNAVSLKMFARIAHVLKFAPTSVVTPLERMEKAPPVNLSGRVQMFKAAVPLAAEDRPVGAGWMAVRQPTPPPGYAIAAEARGEAVAAAASGEVAAEGAQGMDDGPHMVGEFASGPFRYESAEQVGEMVETLFKTTNPAQVGSELTLQIGIAEDGSADDTSTG